MEERIKALEEKVKRLEKTQGDLLNEIVIEVKKQLEPLENELLEQLKKINNFINLNSK